MYLLQGRTVKYRGKYCSLGFDSHIYNVLEHFEVVEVGCKCSLILLWTLVAGTRVVGVLMSESFQAESGFEK